MRRPGCRKWSLAEAVELGKQIGVDWSRVDARQFRIGLEVEGEHGSCDPQTDVTGDDPVLVGKIALAHLKEMPDYYTQLAKIEKGGKQRWR